MPEQKEIPPISIDPIIHETEDKEYIIELLISCDLAPAGGIWQTLPFIFDSKEDAEKIANRTIDYYAKHGVAPNFEDPNFRSEDENVAMNTPPA